jgi:hypothetical protein
MMEAGGCLEPDTVCSVVADEPCDLVNWRNARTAATELRPTLAVDDESLALLGPVHDGKRLGATHLDMLRSDDEPVYEPRIVGRQDASPLHQRRVDRKLGRREDARVVPEPREQRPPRVALRNGS